MPTSASSPDLLGLGPGGLEWRPATPDDAVAVHDLLARAADVDEAQERFTVDDITDELTTPWVDLVRDSRIGIDADDIARAFGLVALLPGDVDLLRPMVFGVVDPQARRRGIGHALLARYQARGAALTRDRRAALGATPPSRLSVMEEQGAAGLAGLLADCGLDVLRYYLVMDRDLHADLPVVPAPTGIRLADFDAPRDAARLRDAHNAAFAEHWGFQPWEPDAWQQWEVGHRDFRPDWSVVALDDDGAVAGYATASLHEQDCQARGVRQGWTNKLGVLPAHRGRGVARALLAEQMRRFAADGMDSAGLDVDADSAAGAVRLYTSLGYRESHRNRLWGLWY
jgi:mycothiol synthase